LPLEKRRKKIPVTSIFLSGGKERPVRLLHLPKEKEGKSTPVDRLFLHSKGKTWD